MLSEITARQRREEEHARLLEALASKVEENTRLHAQLERVRSASVFVVCGITVLFLVACMAIWQLWPAGCTVGARQFMCNGRKIVIRNTEGTILFGWLWCYDGLRFDDQSGYCCTIFRNESHRRSSEIILECERFAVNKWGPNRLFTYVDPSKIRKPDGKYRREIPGYCFIKAGWRFVRQSKDGKHLLAKEATA